jgi:hypothetical protein
MASQVNEAKRKDRSPRYPAIDLQTAINRVVAIYRREGKHMMPNEVAARHWGLSPKSSSVLTTTAALRSFGLLADGRSAGGAGVALTDLGVRLAADEKGVNPARAALIREAAVKPAIFAEILKQYPGGLPSDELLEYHLKTERGFTAEGARAFIRNFRSTLRFAGIEPAGESSGSDLEAGDDVDPEFTSQKSVLADAVAGVTQHSKVADREPLGVRVPVAKGEWATVLARFPMSRSKWQKLMQMLSAMEFALVDDESQDTEQ